MTSILLYLSPPKGFVPQEKVSGCFCEYGAKLLLLKRHPDKPQGGTWCIPSGRQHYEEAAEEAAIRETFEETGLAIKKGDLQFSGKLYVRLTGLDYVFTMFRVRLLKMPGRINLCPEEHTQYGWFTLEEALKLPLILGGKEALLTVYKDGKI